MPRDFIPSRDAELVTWSNTFSTFLMATPTVVGISAAQATAYATLNIAWVEAYNTANASLTRSPANIITKNASRHALIANARMLAKIIQGYPATTNTQRSELGLTVPVLPGPVPAPYAAPALEIGVVTGYTVKIKLHDSTSGSKRGKPLGVTGASVFSFAGAVPPADMSSWKFEGNTTRTAVDIVFANTLAAGSQVWLTAFWFNPRSQSGPACAPVNTHLQGGSVSMAA